MLFYRVCVCEQVLSDEVKRKQYDTYGSAGPSASGAGQQYWRSSTTVDPEELFRKIFGEFTGAQGFGDFSSIFEQPLEVSSDARYFFGQLLYDDFFFFLKLLFRCISYVIL